MSQPPKTKSSRPASGTKSLILGERPSVRLPRRTVDSCVSEPTGSPSPRLIASTPAMKVVDTAPIPGIRMPSLPSAGAIWTLSLAGKILVLLTDVFWTRGKGRVGLLEEWRLSYDILALHGESRDQRTCQRQPQRLCGSGAAPFGRHHLRRTGG